MIDIMNDVIFARTRHEYASYADFWRMVELSGYPVRYLDEIDWQQPIIVIATPRNGEWEGIPAQKKARLIWWNIERSRGDDATSGQDKPSYINEVWASDRAMAQRYEWKYVFLGGHRSFGSVDIMAKEWDIITLMAQMGRRSKLFEELSVFSNADTGSLWGEERHQRLMHSRLMIMCHQDDLAWCEPPRMMLGGCYAMPMLCEQSQDSGYWVSGENYIGLPIDALACAAQMLLKDSVKLARLGAAAWRTACVDHPFRKEVEAAL